MEGFKLSKPKYEAPNSAEEMKKQWKERLETEVDSIATSNFLESEDQKKKEIGFNQEQFKLNNCEVTFIGVNHTPETLQAYKSELQSAVKNADMVMLEGSPEIQLGDRSMEDDLKERGVQGLEKNEVNGIRDRFVAQLDGPWAKLFQGMSDLSAIEGKTVILADAQNLLGASQKEWQKYLDHWHKEVPNTVLEGAAGLMIAGLAAEGSARIMEQNKPTSRRGFLKALGRGALGVAAAGALSQTAQRDLDNEIQNEGNILKMGSVRRGAEETVVYSLTDLRNIVIAETLEHFSKAVPPGTRLTIVYGEGHQKSIHDYLAHPELRALKKRVYLNSGNNIPKSIASGAWQFDYESGRWNRDAKTSQFLEKIPTEQKVS